MRSHGFLYSLITVMVLLWSGNFIIGKVALREFPPLLLSGLRVGLAGVMISPVYWWNKRNRSEATRWTSEDLPILIYLGVFGVALNQLFFVYGLNRTSVAHSAMIIALTPILVLLIAAIVKQEQMTARKMAGMALAVAGVAILNAFPDPAAGQSSAPTLLGDLFTFLAGLTFALFTVIGKRTSVRLDAVTVNTFAYAGGTLALAPITIWQGTHFSFEHVTIQAWASLIYMALFPSVVCYLIYYYALKYIPASRVSAFSYLQPVVATVMAVTLLGEHVTIPLVAGGSVIFAGVCLTETGG